MSVKKSEVEASLVNAWSCFKRDEMDEASSWAAEARHLLDEAAEKGGWEFELQPVAKLRLRDWWIFRPIRWLSPNYWRRRNSLKNVTPDHKEKVIKGKKTMKKLIGVLCLSAVVGAGANHITPLLQGPTSVDRGQFSAVSQCDTCDAIRLDDVDVCTDCGATESVERIAAPLTHKHLGLFMRVDDGWQFKDGSTLFETEGEYVVPELVIRTRRM